jgi:DNA polymerase-3 subunit delta'
MRIFRDLEFLIDDSANQSNINLLSAMVREDHISHAYLFTGNNIEQLHRMALVFAASINCKKGGCGNCGICSNIIKGVHPNILVVEPEGKILRVEEIAVLQRFMGMSAYGPGRKICIIKEAELMNAEAGNRLLKTLEDPPDPESVFILLTEDTSVMLPTILSRCLVYKWDLEFEDDSEKKKEFKVLEKYIDDGIKEIMSGDSLGVSLLDLSIRILEILKKMEAGLKAGLEKEVDQIKGSGYAKEDIDRYTKILRSRHKRQLSKFNKLGISRVFDIISAWLEDIISVEMGAGREDLNFKKNYEFINNRLKGIKTEKILKTMEKIEKNRLHLGYSLNPELALDNIFFHVKFLK